MVDFFLSSFSYLTANEDTSVGKGSSVSNNGSMDSVGNNRGMDGVGNDGSVSNNLSGSRSIAGSSFIGDLSNKSKVVVSMVGGGLDSAIGKSNGVRSSNVSVVILGFSLSEVSSTVVITYSILIGEGFRGFIIGLRGIGSDREGSSGSYKSRGKDNLKNEFLSSQTLQTLS